MLTDRRSGLRVHEGAAAGRENDRRSREQAPHHAALAVAEFLLAIPAEQLGDRTARGGFDLGVRVEEGQPESRCDATSDRRLAGAHQADKDNAAAVERARQRRPLIRGGLDHRGVACHGARG
jgi:hypothetical protein